MVNVSNSQANNVFKDFPQLKFGQPVVAVNPSLLVNKPDSIDIKNETADSKQLASVNVSDIQDKKSGKKGGIIAATVGTTILLTGIAVLVLTKGFSSVAYKKINGVLGQINDKILGSKKSKPYMEKAPLALAKGFSGFLSGLKAVANFNAMKDSFVNKVFRSTKLTTKIADGTTKLFKKFSYDSIDSAYNKVQVVTDDFYADLIGTIAKVKADKNIDLTQEIMIKEGSNNVKRSIGDLLKNLEEHSDNMQSAFKDGFNKNARNLRKEERQKGLDGLHKKVWDALYHDGNGGIFNFKANIDKFKSYITEDLSIDGKVKLKDIIIDKRRALTNNVKHNATSVKSNIQEISGTLKLDDKETRNVLNEISEKIKEYSSFAGPDEAKEREKLVQVIDGKFQELSTKVKQSDQSYSVAEKTFIDSKIKSILDDVLKNDQKGSIQEIMTIVNALKREPVLNANKESVHVLDEKLVDELDKKSHSITKKINKATTMESEDLYDKCAEFEVGSAPSDVVGLVAPVGVAAYAISKGDDKNERISTTLTTGIPIVGSIGSMFYGTTRMLAGPKNLGLAVGIGFVLNLVGNACDKLYKNYQEKRSFTKMAIDAYKNNALFVQQTGSKKI